MTESTQRGQLPIERFLLHVVQAITVAGIIGGYVVLSDLRTSTAVLQTQIISLSQRVDDFRAMASDRYTSTEAERDRKPMLEVLSDHETRIRALERRRGVPQ
jgi:hypothetical protein